MVAICTNVWIITFRSPYGAKLVIDWAQYYPDSYQAMLSVILISTLLLLTSLIRAAFDNSTIPVKKLVYFSEKHEFYRGNIEIRVMHHNQCPTGHKIVACDTMETWPIPFLNFLPLQQFCRVPINFTTGWGSGTDRVNNQSELVI
eukprot:sb/3473942/